MSSLHETDEQRVFNRKVEEILSRIYSHEGEAIRAAMRELERLRTRTVLEMSKPETDEFTVAQKRRLIQQIDKHLADFKAELTTRLEADLRKAGTLGQQLIDQPLAVAGLSQASAGLSREAVQVASLFSADLIKGLSDDLRERINETLRRVVLGGITMQDAITEVGRSLQSEDSIFKSIASRAETIVRTEVLRMQSIATQARMEAQSEITRKAGYEMHKEWRAAMDKRTRLTHVTADGQEKKVDEMFVVGGEKCLYPRDPSLSAGESINCRCASIPVVKKIALPVAA